MTAMLVTGAFTLAGIFLGSLVTMVGVALGQTSKTTKKDEPYVGDDLK